MKTIFTSNYARCGEHPNAYAISAFPPKWYDGKTLPILAPTWEIVDGYKTKKLSETQYQIEYLTLLTSFRRLTPQQIYDSIPDHSILLCYESPGDFCHRIILAEWLETELGVSIPEWLTEEELKKARLVDDLLKF